MLTQVTVIVYRQFNRIVPVPGDLKSGMPAEVLTPEKRVRYYRQILHERTSPELLFHRSRSWKSVVYLFSTLSTDHQDNILTLPRLHILCNGC